MGEFAEDAIEREWYHHICDEEHVDIFNDCGYYGGSRCITEYPKIDTETLQKILDNKEGFLIRKRNGKLNLLVTCVWQGEKSFLCRIEDFGERVDIGKKFFVPKSIVTYNKEEKLVIYLPVWAKPVYSKD